MWPEERALVRALEALAGDVHPEGLGLVVVEHGRPLPDPVEIPKVRRFSSTTGSKPIPEEQITQ